MWLIIGASGMLGKSILKELSSFGSPALYAPSHKELDVTNELAVRSYIKKTKPKFVINCSVASNVDWCESNTEQANTINGTSVKYIGAACKSVKAKLIHVSSDYVFSGNKVGSYVETDVVDPIQGYGQSKLIGERCALELGHIVMRVQWLYGNSRTNFIDFVCNTIKQGKKASISIDQIGAPHSTEWVAKILVLSANKLNLPDVYHVAHDNFSTRWDNICEISKYFEVNVNDYFVPTLGSNFGVARRPLNTCLNNSKLKAALGLNSLGTWEPDLKYYLQQNYKR